MSRHKGVFRHKAALAIAGFGTFSLSERAARKGRNSQTGAEIEIKASKGVKFKAGKALADRMK